MTVVEELNGLIATWHLRGIEGGYVTIQGVRRWAQEIRELRAENFSMRGELGGIEAMVIPEVARQIQAENIILEERLERLQAERDCLQIDNAQLQQQLTIAESGKDPLSEI